MCREQHYLHATCLRNLWCSSSSSTTVAARSAHSRGSNVHPEASSSQSRYRLARSRNQPYCDVNRNVRTSKNVNVLVNENICVGLTPAWPLASILQLSAQRVRPKNNRWIYRENLQMSVERTIWFYIAAVLSCSPFVGWHSSRKYHYPHSCPVAASFP